ncbi:hypothetical protein NPIL_523741 [Nephila pilipes]|uniref:Uncharacterized protein n=1 Tax=Nephila pilipes TaxID=299642 RepID=A0A8X6UN52_NEPPI|nr:hypothetical protein NPIL_523741 [Nephila pilipes]
MNGLSIKDTNRCENDTLFPPQTPRKIKSAKFLYTLTLTARFLLPSTMKCLSTNPANSNANSRSFFSSRMTTLQNASRSVYVLGVFQDISCSPLLSETFHR